MKSTISPLSLKVWIFGFPFSSTYIIIFGIPLASAINNPWELPFVFPRKSRFLLP
jgi:hypothetical protein